MDRLTCQCCGSHFYESISIFNYFSSPPMICNACRSKLIKDDVRRCSHCHKKLAEDEIECQDCRWLHQHYQKIDVINCLYDYHHVEDLIKRYKFHNDIHLSKVFAMLIKEQRQLLERYDYIVPLPSSPSKILQRGFGHMEEIGRHLNCKAHHLKMHDRKKQSELTKRERINEGNPFYVTAPMPGRVLLIDDIYTTGLTVHRAAEILRKNETEFIGVLTFARV